MGTLTRQSPVEFNAEVLHAVVRGDWPVVIEFAGQGDGPYLIDLSHCSRWDVQRSRLDQGGLAGLDDVTVPADAGGSALRAGTLVNRLNQTQASVWHLHGEPVALPEGESFTDVTEATAFLALVGAGALRVAERLSNLDFGQPGRVVPFMLQGPFSNVPCQIAVMGTRGARSGLLLTCSRGYARDMVRAILRAGDSAGLRPAGEAAFAAWLADSAS